MYTATNIDKNKPPKATKFLRTQILCGLCKFKCCNSPSLVVECTPQEQQLLQLPQVFPQEGKCRCLTPEGCQHGEQRPIFCQLFPLQVDKHNNLVLSHWAVLNCPTAKDYKLIGVSGDKGVKKYRYARNEVSAAKRNNSAPMLELSEPLNNRPQVIDLCKKAVVHFYGLEVWTSLKLKVHGYFRGGFGLWRKP